MDRYKQVNDKRVRMSPEEEAIHDAEKAEWGASMAKTAHVFNRQQGYYKAFGTLEGQLDFIYHNGIDAWKAEIKKVKDKYPKSS